MFLRFFTVLFISFGLSLAAHAAPVASPVSSSAGKPVHTTKAKTGRININTADVETLTFLIGIGEKKAQAIVDYRNEHGPFRTIKQLEEVKGIGPATLEKNKGLIVLK